MSQLTIAVTGGAGYKGCVLIPMLLERGYKVKMIDNFMFGYEPILHFANHPNLTVVNGDARKAEDLRPIVKGADFIIHLAGIVGFPACAQDESRAISTNLDATKLLVDVMDKGQRLLYASTGSTYGKTDELCDETKPINPLTLYGRTKAESETIIYDSPHGENATSLRFATVFGSSPRMRLDLMVNDFTYKAINDKIIVMYEGHFKRTFLHIVDAAKSYLCMIDNWEKAKGEVFNIGDESLNYTKKEVAVAIGKKVKYELYEADVGTDLDARNYHVNYDKVQKLGYKAGIDMPEGIDELVKIISFMRVRAPFRNA